MSFLAFFVLGCIVLFTLYAAFRVVFGLYDAFNSGGSDYVPGYVDLNRDPEQDYRYTIKGDPRTDPNYRAPAPEPRDTRTQFEKVFGCKEEDYKPCDCDPWEDLRRRKQEAEAAQKAKAEQQRRDKEEEERLYEELKARIREKEERQRRERTRKQETPQTDRKAVEQEFASFMAEAKAAKWNQRKIIREGAKRFHPDKHGNDPAYTETMQQVVAFAKGW